MIDAWVVLPDHMHCLWTLPAGDADLPGRWRAIKIAFSKSMARVESQSPVMTRPANAASGNGGIGNTGYATIGIFPPIMDYVHFNPVKQGVIGRPAD